MIWVLEVEWIVLSLLTGLAKKEKDCVFVAVAGRSNALGGVLDGNSLCPVINCPPYSKKYKGLDVLSSLRMPSRIACTTILEPENAGLAALKILALKDAKLKKKLKAFLKAAPAPVAQWLEQSAVNR